MKPSTVTQQAPRPQDTGAPRAASQQRSQQRSPQADPPQARRVLSLHPITWGLVVFAFLNFAGAFALIAIVSPRDIGASAPAVAARTALRHAADDSWKPMQLALDEVETPEGGRIYPRLFFEQRVKFQYPPSSLLSLDALRSFGRRDLELLNGISWVFVLALAVVVPGIYLLAWKQFSPGASSRFTNRDLVVQCLVVAALTLTFYPVTRGYVLGQIQTWLTALFGCAVLAWAARREGLSGVLIGIIVTVKPQLAVLLVWAAVQRRRRFLVGCAAAIVLLEAVALWRYGLRNHLDYLPVLSYLSAHGESFFANQSVNGLLARLLHVGNNLEWDARSFPPYHPVVYVGTLISSCVMIGLALFTRWPRMGDASALVKFAIASLLLTMASPIAWEHHYGVLAPIYAVLLPLFLGAEGGRKWLVCLAGTYFVASNPFPFLNRTAGTPWNFVQSYLFAAAVVLIATVYLRDREARRLSAGQFER